MVANKNGFTLVELITVIAVIAVLAGGLISALSPQTQLKKARDTRRKSDLNQYRIALEAFATANEMRYPSRNTAVPAATTLCISDLTITYLSSCPQDPKNTIPYIYYYQTESTSPSDGSATANNYILYGGLEVGSDNYWVICSDGSSKAIATVPANTDCGF